MRVLVLALLIAIPARGAESEPDRAILELASRHPATRPGEVFVYAKAARTRETSPKWFEAAPVISSPWDRPKAPPAWHVIDGLCFGDAAVSAAWLDAVRAEIRKSRGESILDMLADWSTDSCPTSTPCRFAAEKAAIEKNPEVAAHLWDVAADCPDPALTPVFEASAPSDAIVQHLWLLQLHDKPVRWTKRYERLIPDALAEVARSVRAGHEASWFDVTHAAEVVASIHDPAALKAIRAAHGAAKGDAKDAIATGFGFVRGDAEAKALFEAACRNPVHADTCASVRDHAASREAAPRALAELIDDEDFDARGWANTDARRAELRSALLACESESCLHHLAALDWNAARARAKQLRAARAKEAGEDAATAMERTLERFDTRDALVAEMTKAGLVGPGVAAAGDVTLHDLMRRSARVVSFERDDDEQIWPAPNDHVLRHVLVRLAGIREARVVQTSGKKDKANEVARCEISVWLDGERFREPFLCDESLQFLPAVAIANTVLEARGSALRVAPGFADEVVIGPKDALAKAIREGLIEAFQPEPDEPADE